jgi:hypothetical protein
VLVVPTRTDNPDAHCGSVQIGVKTHFTLRRLEAMCDVIQCDAKRIRTMVCVSVRMTTVKAGSVGGWIEQPNEYSLVPVGGTGCVCAYRTES